MTTPSNDPIVCIFRDTTTELVRREGPDLTLRQLAIFLICYLNSGHHTVRGLAAKLNISKPAVSRSLDRLGQLGLASRLTDQQDRRSILVQRTSRGSSFLRDLVKNLDHAITLSEKRITRHVR